MKWTGRRKTVLVEAIIGGEKVNQSEATAWDERVDEHRGPVQKCEKIAGSFLSYHGRS